MGKAARSMIVQMVAMVMGGILGLQLIALSFLQTPLVFQFFPWALADNADAIAEVVWLVEQVPEDLEPYILSVYRGSGRAITIREEMADNLKSIPSLRKQFEYASTDAADRLIGRDIRFKRLNAYELRAARWSGDPNQFAALAGLQISIPMEDGRVLEIRLAPSVYLAARPSLIFAFLAFWVFVGSILSLALARIALRPLRQLERDAEELSVSANSPPVSETGPTEIRRVAQALNRMQERLALLTHQRERMVAAIAHDVRTSITKLRLRMDNGSEVKPQTLESDLAHMELLVTDMLVYARAEDPAGPLELVDLPQFLKQVVTDFPSDIGWADQVHDGGFEIAADPVALRRLVDNLLENARRYGGVGVSTELISLDGALVFSVLDHGPGLPEEMLETVFEPFMRVETSRSRDTGGSGLGLGIALAIARAHGASLVLKNRPEGGLAAVLSFPASLKA